MQNTSLSTSLLDNDVNSMYWNLLRPTGGIKPGELTVFYAKGRATSISHTAKMTMNSIYGKLGKEEPWVKTVTVKKAYKSEWCVRVPWQVNSEVRSWLKETLGECGHNRKYRWREAYNHLGTYFLRDEADVLMFRLRWV